MGLNDKGTYVFVWRIGHYFLINSSEDSSAAVLMKLKDFFPCSLTVSLYLLPKFGQRLIQYDKSSWFCQLEEECSVFSNCY